MANIIGYGRFNESVCPQCGYGLDSAMLLHGIEQKPMEGDAAVCLNCSQLLTYQADLSLRKATASEIRELMGDSEAWSTIEKSQMFIRQRGRIA